MKITFYTFATISDDFKVLHIQYRHCAGANGHLAKIFFTFYKPCVLCATNKNL